MEKAKKVVYRAIRETQYDDGNHGKRIFKAGEIFPVDWKQGCPGWKNFAPENEMPNGWREAKVYAENQTSGYFNLH